MDFNYKKYSLENLENWLHDAMSSGEATPQEIYDVIKGVVEEQYYHHKHYTGQAYELLALLNSNKIPHATYDDMIAAGYEMTADGFWIPPQKEDKVVKWQLPVQVDGLTGDCYVEFPDDLLEAANLEEGDAVEWIDRNDGSFELRKVTKSSEVK